MPGQPARVAVKADADLPDLKMHATMTLRKNTDPTLLATHTIDLKFSFADGAPITGVKDVEPKMRNLGSTAPEALRAVKVKISDVYFLIALAEGIKTQHAISTCCRRALGSTFRCCSTTTASQN
jgi:hypothetical protein